MKQTAVEWLEQLLFNKQGKFTKGDIEQAKEIEKQQQGYSEEEVIKILYQFHYDLVNSNFDTKEEWFEQFKNK
jgi:hypothetical protein